MEAISPCVQKLLAEKVVPRSQVSARDIAFMRPLFDGGVLSCERAGRGEIVQVVHEEAFRAWVRRNFPAFENTWTAPEWATRAQAVASRRDSKAGGPGVEKGVLHLRALDLGAAKVWLDDQELPVGQMTVNHGLAACLIDDRTRLKIEGRTALIENLECFLNAEVFLSKVSVVLNSAGRISDRLIVCLRECVFSTSPLLHAPDYDPVGLSDYLRLHMALGDRVQLWVPPDLELRFATFGNRDLISGKRRNRALLEQLSTTRWPCETSARVFRLIKESGSGLEQEGLLISPKLRPPVDG